MPFWVYILQSQTSGRFYCGQTADLEKRLAQHNDPQNTFTRTTKVFDGPWQFIWTFQLQNRTEALRLEKKIKKRGIQRFINDMSIQEGGC